MSELINLELEQAILAAILDPKINGYARAAEASVTSATWASPKHAATWVLICRVVSAGGQPDPWAVYEEAAKTTAGELRDAIKGKATTGDGATGQASEWIEASWLSDLSNASGPVTHVDRNLTALMLLARQRAIVTAAKAMVLRLERPAHAADLDAAIAALLDVGTARTDRASVSLGQATVLAADRHDAILAGGDTGATWGLMSLDNALPLATGRTIVLAAPPGCGKTSLKLQAARETAFRCPGSAAFLSLEVGPEDLAVRVVASMANVDPRAFASGRLAAEEVLAIRAMEARLEAADLQLRAPASSQIDSVCGWIRAQHQRGGGRLRLVCVDYLQRISTANQRHMENDRLTEICAKLTRLAVELKVCVLVGSQFSREGTKGSRSKTGEIETAQPEPRASDLRGSGSIEQDANGIIGLWRKNQSGAEVTEVMACILKNREGESGGKIRLMWDKARGLWTDAPEDEEDAGGRSARLASAPNESEEVF